MNQKIAERIISDNNETDSVEKMINLKILKNFQLNIYHALAFMIRVKNETIPEAFKRKFETVLAFLSISFQHAGCHFFNMEITYILTEMLQKR